MAFDEPRTQPPAEFVRDGERPGGRAEARPQQTLAADR